MRRPRDVAHRVVTGHWPRWIAIQYLYPVRMGKPRCRDCSSFTFMREDRP